MKNLFLLIFAFFVQISFAQYLFKYESQITTLEEIPVNNNVAKASDEIKAKVIPPKFIRLPWEIP